MNKKLRYSIFLCLLLVNGRAESAEKKIWKPLPNIDALEAEIRVSEPVEIGRRKQLFLDKYLVDSTDEVLFTMMAPQRHRDNPLLSPDVPTDGQLIMPTSVHWNPDKSVFQMWYAAVHFENGNEEHYTAYAESEDGLKWHRPIMNLIDFNGSKANNLITGGGYVIKDDHDPDKTRQYKSVGSGGDARSVNINYSSDGVSDWRGSSLNPLFRNTGDTHTLLGWDEKMGKYIGYFRPMGTRPKALVRQQQRQIAVSFSDDGEKWSPMVPVLAPDAHDPPGTEFYRLTAIRYEDYFVGLVSVLHMDSANLDFYQPDPVGVEQTVDMQLVVSRDAVTWTRVGNRAPWLSLAPFQSWDDMVLWPTFPIIVGDEIRVYYGGFPVRHQLADLHLSVEKVSGRTRHGSIGLATLRRDGWVAVRANGKRNGTLITRSLAFEGTRLEINADASNGKIIVELLDKNYNPIPGFSGAESVVINSDSIRQNICWERPLGNLGAQPIRIRFSIQGDAKLYAFQFCD